MTDTGNTGGQAAPDSVGTTGNAPEGSTATVGNGQTTGNGPDAGAESFFDPSSIQDKPELLAAYKQMQASYTKRMQQYAAHKSKVEAYDKFASDPVGTVKALAAQYGLNLVPSAQDQPKDWNPQSWDDVMKEAESRVLKKMEPVYGELRNLKKQSIESQLDSKFPDWRTYEPEMMDALNQHPSLVSDPEKLYRIAVPQDVWEAQATAKAMKKLKGATESGQLAGGTTAKPTTQQPSGPMTFEQAAELARKRVASMGLSRPS